MSTKSSKAAQALIRKQDEQAAMIEYNQQRSAEWEKSARLRALRLAKEAADCEIAAQAAVRKAAIMKAPAKKPVAKRRKAVVAMDAVNA